MKKRYSVELTSGEIALVIQILQRSILRTEDEEKTAEAVVHALIDARPLPDAWPTLAKRELRRLHKKLSAQPQPRAGKAKAGSHSLKERKHNENQRRNQIVC